MSGELLLVLGLLGVAIVLFSLGRPRADVVALLMVAALDAGPLRIARQQLHQACGALLTTFSFNWVMNWWALDQLSQGKVPDGTIILAVDVAFIVVFVVLTYAFGFFSKLLFLFLLDIDVLYVCRIARHFLVPLSGGWNALGTGIGVATVVLAGLALYISFALLVNPGRSWCTLRASASSGPEFGLPLGARRISAVDAGTSTRSVSPRLIA